MNPKCKVDFQWIAKMWEPTNILNLSIWGDAGNLLPKGTKGMGMNGGQKFSALFDLHMNVVSGW